MAKVSLPSLPIEVLGGRRLLGRVLEGVAADRLGQHASPWAAATPCHQRNAGRQGSQTQMASQTQSRLHRVPPVEPARRLAGLHHCAPSIAGALRRTLDERGEGGDKYDDWPGEGRPSGAPRGERAKTARAGKASRRHHGGSHLSEPRGPDRRRHRRRAAASGQRPCGSSRSRARRSASSTSRRSRRGRWRTSSPSAGHRVHFEQADLTDIAALKAAIAVVRAAIRPDHRPGQQCRARPAPQILRGDARLFGRPRWRSTSSTSSSPRRRSIPDMIAAGGGAIVNFGSGSWLIGQGGLPSIRRQGRRCSG